MRVLRSLLLLMLAASVADAADQECRQLPLSWQFAGDASNASFTPPTPVTPEFPVRPIGHGVALTGGKVYSPPQRLQTPVAEGRSPIVRQSDSPARAAKILNRSDPVSPNGELIETVTDLHLAGVGIDFDLTRTYRSGVYYFGPLGFS